MSDAEYQRLRRAAIKAGTHTRKQKISAAEHQRAYRERKKAKATQSTDHRTPERAMSDAALEAAIMRRGKQLTQMMRTPLCMWPADWLTND